MKDVYENGNGYEFFSFFFQNIHIGYGTPLSFTFSGYRKLFPWR